MFGNKSADSGTGVAFTRNPATGENVFFGEYLEQAQGEDVVSGVRTPHSLAFLQQHMPEAYQELDKYQRLLETHFRDMQGEGNVRCVGEGRRGGQEGHDGGLWVPPTSLQGGRNGRDGKS